MLILNLNGSAERFCTSGGRAAGVRLIGVLKIALNDAAERRDVYSDAISSRMNQPRAKCLASRSMLKEEKNSCGSINIACLPHAAPRQPRDNLRTSAAVTYRQSPGRKRSSFSGPMRVRESFKTECPIASNMRRIC